MLEKENYFKSLILKMTETEEGRYFLSETIGKCLSDRYGYCHFGFNFDTDIDNDGDPVRVFNIQWDVDTVGEVDSALLKMLGLPEETFISVYDLHLDDEYLKQQVLSDEELFIQEAFKLDEDLIQDVLSAQETMIQQMLSDEENVLTAEKENE